VGESASWAETLDKTTSPHLNLIVLNPMSYMAMARVPGIVACATAVATFSRSYRSTLSGHGSCFEVPHNLLMYSIENKSSKECSQ
jgi:hypothetical protein